MLNEALGPMEEVYPTVEKLLHSMVKKFRKKYGGDHNELMGEANQFFLHAYKSFTPGEGRAFPGWVYFITWKLLHSSLQKELKQNTRRADVDMGTLRAREVFNPHWLMEEVTQDAREVVSLVVDTPLDVLLTARGMGGEHRPNNLKRAIIEYLKDIGWGLGRITEAFAEVRDAL